MLNIIGGSGDALREKLLSMAAQGGRILVVVPEQYTLQTERELMDGLGTAGFFDLEVLSPSRLTERVFAQAGADGMTRIDGRGKQFALARALMQVHKKLRYYESAADKQGFIRRMGALIADFKRAGVTPDQLSAYGEELPEGAEKDKFSDLALIYAAYAQGLSGQFVDGEDVLESMLQRLPASGIAEDALVVVYGFDVFTGQMNRMILALAGCSRETAAMLILGEEEAFDPVRESARRLENAAREAGMECRMAMLPQAADRRPAELAHLARHYLAMPPREYQGICGAIRLYAAPNPYFEAHFAAQEMLLLHEKGVPFGEMAVAMGDAAFAGTLETVLASYEIPAYVTRKLPATDHGAVRFILASLRAVGQAYDAQDMLAVIKSGYAPIAEMDIWRLENYIVSYAIRGKMWLSPFQRGSTEECARLEDARSRFITPLEGLRQGIRNARGARDALQALYAYLEETGVYEKLLENEEKLLAQGMAAQAVQARQVWEALMQLLSQAHALLNDVKVSARQLSVWLEAGLEDCRLSSLPPAADAVMCGVIGSLPLSRPRALFMMNMTDGLLGSSDSGLLTPAEQENAQQKLQVYLSLDDDGRDQLKYLDVWKALSVPQEHLFLTRSQGTQDGAALRPFAQLSHIRNLFPGLVEEGGVSQRWAAQMPLAPGPALDALGARMQAGSLDGEWLAAWKYLSQAPETKDRADRLISAFRAEKNAPPLPRDVTHALFMERVMSVSRLEQFAACPYKHFVEQGLSPQPRKEWTLTPIDAGNFYHSALEGFTRLLPALENWPRIDKKTCDAAVDRAAEPLFAQLMGGVMGDSARMRALGEKYRRVLRRVAWTFTKGARVSAFETRAAEIRFGYAGGIPPIELTLPDGSRVYIRGIIDRIDRYAGDEGVYLRVVDYKSGNQKLDAARIFHGAQLQLLLYLQAALSMEEGASPAGAFYMHVADPILPDREETAQLEDALARMLHLKGVALRDAAILKKMDSEAPPLTLPKVLTADGGFDKRALLANLEEMRGLIAHAGKMAAEMAHRMRAGEIAAAPLCDGNQKGPCDTCDYALICRRDISRAPENARLMQEIRFDDLLENVNKNSAGNFEKNHV
ncbi:MAG: hypothetical protein E7324_00830 [Clostridiales bacterium]|nr:hypothetical protein [Clostridiales bacterium]